MLFVHQPYDNIAACTNPVIRNLIDPVVVVEVTLKLTPLKGNVAEFLHPGHLRFREPDRR